MTEEQAKTKWCPFANRDALGNRTVDDEGKPATFVGCRCIASTCMTWRWANVANPEWKTRHQMMSGYETNPYDEIPTGIPSTTDGYCGLASRGML